MIKELLETFRPPSAEELSRRELEDAKRELLKAHSGREYAEAMVAYHQRRINRLTSLLGVAGGTQA